MTNKEKIVFLKEYKKYLLSLKKYQKQLEKKQVQENQVLDKPKVLVLKKKFYGKDMVAA